MFDINYIKITKFDTSNGPGIRTVLWVAGCMHKCKGCHNPDTWDAYQGKLFTEYTMQELLDSLESEYISGITFSGGDPLHPNNINVIAGIILIIREKYPDKSIWLYTGYNYERLLSLMKSDHDISVINILENIDVLVDGLYIEKFRNITLPYCGSENQRVIDVKRSLKENTVILYEDC